jgi:hypothetical protein
MEPGDGRHEGVRHCYAETFAERWRGIEGHPFEQGFDVCLWPERLTLPLRWRKPKGFSSTACPICGITLSMPS